MKDKIREITITEVANGYLVKIGCCVFVFKQGELLEELTEYIREPRKTEKRYLKELGIRDDLQPVEAVREPPRYTALSDSDEKQETSEESRLRPIRND